MLWQQVSDEGLQPKLYLNGFPKAGLHLLMLLARAMLEPMSCSPLRDGTWAGALSLNGFGGDLLPLERALYKMSELCPGFYLKGHCGYSGEIERFMYYSGFAHVFIYRDLRDVAVSQVHHALSMKDTSHHPAKDMFREMGFDDALAAVIEGLGPMPGIVERWEMYAPWLDVDWVHCVKFEDILADREGEARKMLTYTIERLMAVLRHFGVRLRTDQGCFDEAVADMVRLSQQTVLSPTFREGKVGGWQKVFADRHRELFSAHGGDMWLERLGYRR